jgi:hypothetical protein
MVCNIIRSLYACKPIYDLYVEKENRALQPCISRYFSNARILAMSNLVFT